MRERYAPRYDGTHWGVWDREKNRWSFYPSASLEAAQTAAKRRNRLGEQPVPLQTQEREEPEPIPFPDPTFRPPDTFRPQSVLTSLEMMARMIEMAQREREEALARLPVQSYARPIPAAVAASVLDRKARN
jgi:hypothetical protein